MEQRQFLWHWATFTVIHTASLFKWIFFVQLCSIWQGFIWHSASRGSSATAELLVCFRDTTNYAVTYTTANDWTVLPVEYSMTAELIVHVFLPIAGINFLRNACWLFPVAEITFKSYLMPQEICSLDHTGLHIFVSVSFQWYRKELVRNCEFLIPHHSHTADPFLELTFTFAICYRPSVCRL